MERRQMLAAVAGVAMGGLGMALPVAADESADGREPGQRELARQLAADVHEAISQAIAEYQAMHEGMRSKPPVRAFEELAGYRRIAQVQDCTVTVAPELGLIRLRFVIGGPAESLASLRNGLAAWGYPCNFTYRSLSLVVEVPSNRGQVPQLLAQVHSNRW